MEQSASWEFWDFLVSVGFEEMPTSEGEPRRKQRSEEDSEEGIWVSRIPTFLFAEGADYFFFSKNFGRESKYRQHWDCRSYWQSQHVDLIPRFRFPALASQDPPVSSQLKLPVADPLLQRRRAPPAPEVCDDDPIEALLWSFEDSWFNADQGSLWVKCGCQILSCATASSLSGATKEQNNGRKTVLLGCCSVALVRSDKSRIS